MKSFNKQTTEALKNKLVYVQHPHTWSTQMNKGFQRFLLLEGRVQIFFWVPFLPFFRVYVMSEMYGSPTSLDLFIFLGGGRERGDRHAVSVMVRCRLSCPGLTFPC